MAAGYSLGPLLLRDTTHRRRALWIMGAGATLLFVLLRASNVYGNAELWSPQRNILYTIFSFIDCHKYPPSLCYLLMTLGPSLLLLAWLDRGTPRILRFLLVFGRVPLFYYLLHLPILHGLAVVMSWIEFGRADWLYGKTPGPAPAGAGYSLPMVYLVWLVVVALLFPICRWFAELKRRRREGWLSYL